MAAMAAAMSLANNGFAANRVIGYQFTVFS